ncbi:MAG: FAD-dependent oxidoreductase [Gemmatimonadota bacterium]|jgi:D-amino-acid dehydrogenase
MSNQPRVVIVGGGIIGVSCAYELVRRGAQVMLLERDVIGAGASSGNAGTVSAGHPPLNRPGRVRRALLQMADSTSPLYIEPSWNPDLWRWLVDFARHCTRKSVERSMSTLAPLGLKALEVFDELVDQESIDCAYRRDGYFEVCRTEKGLAGARQEAQLIRRFGLSPQVVDGETLREAEPALSPDVRGGVFFPEARTLDPHRFLQGLASAARRLGASIKEGAAVRRLDTRQDRVRGVHLADDQHLEADAVVLATGPYSLTLAADLGTRLPVQPGKGYHRDLSVGEGSSPALRITCVLNERSVFCTPMNGFVRYAGTMEFSGLNDTLRRDRLDQITRSAQEYLPELRTGDVMSEWCGLRPVASDGLPIVGPLPGVKGLVVATGHGMLGLTLGPVTGEIVADWILEEATDFRWTPLSPERFS